MAKLIAFLSTSCLIILLLRPGGPLFPRDLDSQAVVKEIHELNELATVRYTIQKVVRFTEDKSPLGSEKILLLVQGKIVAGVNLASLSTSGVSFGPNHSVTIRLPIPRILETFLDENFTQVWDRTITWWTPWVSPSPDLEHKARLQALEDVRSQALQMGILKEARKNAEADIKKVLVIFGFKRVDFESRIAD